MKVLLILLTLFICPNTFAEHYEFPGKPFHARVGILIPGFGIEFAPQSNRNNKLKIAPHTPSQIHLGFTISDFIGVGWGFSGKRDEEEDLNKGRTKLTDFRFNFAFKHYLISTNYSDFEGLYLESGPKPFTQFPNMNLRNISFNFVYAFTPNKFSLAGMYDQTKRQQKSGGSFLMATSIEEASFDNHGETFLTGHGLDFGQDALITSAKFLTLNLYGGAGYTISMKKKFYISTSLLFGPGIQQSKIKLVNNEYKNWDATYKFNFNLALGYNGDRFFTGANIFATGTTNRTDHTVVSNNMYTASIFWGIHF